MNGSFMYTILHKIYVLPLPVVVALMIISILIWSISERVFNNLRLIWKAINTVLFIFDIAAIIYCTIISRTSGTSGVYLTPFYSYIEARENSELYRVALMNILLFLPFGLSLPNLMPKDFRHKMLFTIIAAMFLSASIELIQYIFGLGRVETDDVIHNTVGAVLGVLPWLINTKRISKC